MSKPTHIVTLAIAAAFTLSALVPATAATRHKRAAAAQSEVADPTAPPRIRPDWSPIPTPAWQVPNACVSDEGYGRYSSCDSGDAN